MKRTTRIVTAILMLGSGSAALALGVPVEDCGGLRAMTSVLERQADLAAACESVIELDGQRYLRMSAELRQLREEMLVLRFKGTSYDMALSPGATQPIMAAGATRALAPDQAIGSALYLYVPEDRVLEVFADAASLADATVPVTVELAESTAARDARIANYTCCPRWRYPVILPETASPLPLLGLIGVGLLGAGAALTRRRLKGGPPAR